MSLNFGYRTDVGRKRRNNQDGYLLMRGDDLNGELDALFVVADGMGGRKGGEVASDIVIHVLPEYISQSLERRNGFKPPIDVSTLLSDGIEQADRAVKRRQAQEPDLSGMGTTCVAAIVDANRLTIANVGDSRAYLLRGGRLTQLTEDHSAVWEEVKSGRITAEAARTTRFRNVITRCVGSESNATPEIQTYELEEGDSVLLCSDGLSSELPDSEIARIFAGIADPQEACDELVEAASQAGGRDNITVVALRYGKFSPVKLKKEIPPAEDPVEQIPADDMPDLWSDHDLNSEIRPVAINIRGRRAAQRGRGPAQIGALLVLLVLCASVAGGEAYALIRAFRELRALRALPPRTEIKSPYRPTDHDLAYSAATSLLEKRVRSTPLAVDDQGAAYVVSREGNPIRIDKSGRITQLPDQPTLEQAEKQVEIGMLLTVDITGNRYQIMPGAGVIAKYDPEGKLVSGNIGKGSLNRPTALTVDTNGNLYVIDKNVVKKIAASTAAAHRVGAEEGRQ